MNKALLYITILTFVITTFIFWGKWAQLKSELKNIDSFNYSVHNKTDQLEAEISDPLLLSAISLVDSIHFLIILNSGGLNEKDGSSMNFDNSDYPDLVLMEQGYKAELIKRLIAVKEKQTEKTEITYLNHLISETWGENSVSNTVTQISSRLMMTKIGLLTMNKE